MALARIIRVKRVVRVLLFLVLCNGTVAQAQSCRQALVLALDVSGSVNATEYRQQTDGLAAALNAPDVRELILAGTDAPVTLAIYEWSSRNHQFVIQPWVALDSAATLDRVIEQMQAHRPVRAGLKTALGTALTFGAEMLDQQAHCWELTIDVSGDGRNNIGPTPHQAYALDAFERVTVNALVVGNPIGVVSEFGEMAAEDLQAYFVAGVIRGPHAFAIVARGYEDYADAMHRKLIRELSQPMLGLLSPP